MLLDELYNTYTIFVSYRTSIGCFLRHCISKFLFFMRLYVFAFLGRVGKLSIKIPWKKLGWDPVIISLEDVLICASQRDDKEVLHHNLFLRWRTERRILFLSIKSLYVTQDSIFSSIQSNSRFFYLLSMNGSLYLYGLHVFHFLKKLFD